MENDRPVKHASIIPLIGGEAIGSERVTGRAPEYLLSFAAFRANDSHLVNYYAQRGLDVPYHDLDAGPPSFSTSVDSLSSVCPCAGLSALSTSSHADNAKNEWMYIAAEQALGVIKPAVYWGENAPALYTDKGKKVRDALVDIGKKHGYTASFYKTKSLLHGIPQVRNRSFFFFWKGDRAPVFNFFDRPHQRIEDLILSSKGNFQTEAVNKKIPSVDDKFYEYLLTEYYGGLTHRELYEKRRHEVRGGMSVRNNDVLSMIEEFGVSMHDLLKWTTSKGYEKYSKIVQHEINKREAGGGTMRRNTILPFDYIGAFVAHYPHMLAHPSEDRYVNVRESLTIMGMPDDFELLNPVRQINHVCQNVPVQTAADMTSEVMVALGSPSEREWVRGPLMVNNTNRKVESYGEEVGSLGTFF